MNLFTCQTSAIDKLNEQIYRVRIHSDDPRFYQFNAGQYIVLHMPDGRKVPLSIASAPEENRFVELHVRKVEGHELAESMIELFESTDAINVESAMGSCCIQESGRDIIVIAGGTGFSPMKSLIESSFARNLPLNIQLFLGAQVVADLYQDSLIKSWQTQRENFEYHPVISGENEDWQGEVGFPHDIAIKVNGDAIKHKDIYLSGSEAMVMAVYESLIQFGVDKTQIHSDILNIKREKGEIE